MEARREEAQARANGLQQENREAAHKSYKLALAAVDAYDYDAALRRAERAVRLSPGTRAYEELLTSLQLLAEEEAEEEESEEEGEEGGPRLRPRVRTSARSPPDTTSSTGCCARSWA